jgi:transglutaminase-like putative cysteine protease
LPDLGWTSYDPTSGCPGNGRIVKVATGRDFTDVPPNKGIFRGQGEERISVRVATRELERVPSLSWHERLPP